MKTYEFTIVASGLDVESDFEDRFYGAKCDDATIAVIKGKIVLEFAREARNFAHALMSAIVDVIDAGATIDRVEPDYLVSLSDIAERSELSRSAISHYAAGNREKDFPTPIARITSDTPLWDWVAVAKWMYQRKRISLDSLVAAKLVREANTALSASFPFVESSFAQKLHAIIAKEKAEGERSGRAA
jgi:hypothetical protein